MPPNLSDELKTRLAPEITAAIDELADEMLVSRSAILRLAVRDYLRRHGKIAQPAKTKPETTAA